MHSKSNYKHNFILFAFVCFSFFTAIAQKDSIQFYHQKISQLINSPDFTENSAQYIDKLNQLSYYQRLIEQDSMLINSERALELSRKNNYVHGELEALANLATLYLYAGPTDKSIELCLKVIENTELSNFPKTEMKIYNILGQGYYFKNDYPSTYTQFLHTLAIAEKNSDQFHLFRMNMNLGTIFSRLEDYEEALKYYAATFKYVKKLNDPTKEAMLLSNMAYLNINLGNLQQAKIELDETFALLEKNKHITWLSWTYSTLGSYYLKLNDFKNALINYQKSFDLHDGINDVKAKANIKYGLGKSYFGLNNLVKAEKLINDSAKLYESSDHDAGLEDAYRTLYEINKSQNDEAESLKYLELTEKLSNDNFKKENRRNLMMLNAKLNFEKEKEDLKAQNELALNKQRKYVKWSLAGLFTLMVIVFLILSATKREKILNKKLANQAGILNKNQKSLTQINANQDRLFSIVGHDLRGPINSLNDILRLYLEDPEGKVYFEKFAPQLKEDLEQVQFTMDNLLHWGKTQMQGSTINIRSISVKHELDTILQLYRNEIKKKSIVINNQVATNHNVFADQQQFNIIFRNLINNAIKFTPNEGLITISTEIKDKNLVIQVTDTGVGMTEADIQKLFSNTENFSKYGTNLEKGTGLGLRLVKAMVIKNDGEIIVKSQPNQGSQFIVELPVDKA
ncbi:tetratricopeptide repeat-containing sensor histidine kinase [Maribacter sp. 1_MG-2023]|uniref:tetratricopeptide repeat-containing sensor histidine kinase n=1 Tax=Maribacter sp. 1_MG-2023 TaxID=3062677 RepID=UPI0026E4181B|nr:tetratricopeptide repeat-containing sensor histidine kinase [Maribacter sp. 1_MG-2023]MDO6473178.1 tetratricopeptide repeat-containing sensor histidine kinase [Maribacter sp. 1_MG-2023]